MPEGLPDYHLLGTALCNVKNERFQQERLKAEGRFRFTCADHDLSHAEKLAILAEEVGEVAQQVLEQPDRRLAFDCSGSREELRKELTQVAAVATAWIESLLDEPEGGEECPKCAGAGLVDVNNKGSIETRGCPNGCPQEGEDA